MKSQLLFVLITVLILDFSAMKSFRLDPMFALLSGVPLTKMFYGLIEKRKKEGPARSDSWHGLVEGCDLDKLFMYLFISTLFFVFLVNYLTNS